MILAPQISNVTRLKTLNCDKMASCSTAAALQDGHQSPELKNPMNGRTFMRQKVMSVWQSDVHSILTRTSCARGGATSTSSISSGCPATLLTAAARCLQASQ